MKLKVKITALLSVYDLSYEMSALLSSEERSEMHQQVIENTVTLFNIT